MRQGMLNRSVLAIAMVGLITLVGCMSPQEASERRDELAGRLQDAEAARGEVATFIAELRQAIADTDDEGTLGALTEQLARAEAAVESIEGRIGRIGAEIAEVEDGPADAQWLDIAAIIGTAVGVPGMGALAVIARRRRQDWRAAMDEAGTYRDALGRVVRSVDPLVKSADPETRKGIKDEQGPDTSMLVKRLKAGGA